MVHEHLLQQQSVVVDLVVAVVAAGALQLRIFKAFPDQQRHNHCHSPTTTATTTSSSYYSNSTHVIYFALLTSRCLPDMPADVTVEDAEEVGAANNAPWPVAADCVTGDPAAES